MREFINIVEKVVADFYSPYDPTHTPYPIHHNGTLRDLNKLRSELNAENTSRDIRGLLTPVGDLYFWDGMGANHPEIKSRLGITGFHLTLNADHVGLGWGRREVSEEDWRQAAEKVRTSDRLKALYGADIRVEPAY